MACEPLAQPSFRRGLYLFSLHCCNEEGAVLQRLCSSCRWVWWRCRAPWVPREDCGAGQRQDSQLCSFPWKWPCLMIPPSAGWTLSCRGSWHGPKPGRVLQLKQDGPWAEWCWGFPSFQKPGLQSGPGVSSTGVSSGKQEQAVTRSCKHTVKSGWMFWHGSFLSSYPFSTLGQQSLRLPTARAIYLQLPSCCKVNTGSKGSPGQILEPEGSFIHLISRYVDSDQHHSNYLSHLNKLDTEIATFVIYTAPFIGKFKNVRYQFHWVGKLHSFVDTEVP